MSFGLHVLSLAGLAEAFVYLKRFQELSAGQQYRAMLALLLASGRNIWLVDEFCTNLDPVTASVVAYNFQRIARRTGATAIIAAPDCTNFSNSLKPDRILLLQSSTEHSLLSGAEYQLLMAGHKRHSFPIPRIKVSPNATAVLRKKGTVAVYALSHTIRQGAVILLEDGQLEIPVSITDVCRVTLSHLTNKDAQAAGFTDLRHLRHSLSRPDGNGTPPPDVVLGTARSLCAAP